MMETASIPPATGATPMGEIEAVTIADLHVDPTYQRELKPVLVEKIARKWDIAAAGPIVVSRRENGDLYIVNGQHRAAAAVRAGETEILAQVLTGLNSATEADMRLMGNTRGNDTSLERFKAQVAAGHPDSLSIVAIAEQFDTKINTGADMNSGVSAISQVERLYGHDGNGTRLTRVFEFIQDAFGAVSGSERANAAMMGAFNWLIERHSGEFDRQRMVDKLGVIGPRGIRTKAYAHKTALGGAMWTNYYRAFIEIYNEKLPEGKRLMWRTSGWSRSREANPHGAYDAPTSGGGGQGM